MDHNRGLFVSLIAVLLAFGTLMVYSASITSWPSEFERLYLSRHLVFLLIGVLAGALCASLPARFWLRAGPWLFALSAGLLIAVLVPGVGVRVHGAQRWLRLGPLSLQPSELAKVALPLFLARLLCRPKGAGGDVGENPGLFNKPGFFGPVLPTGVVAALVFVEPDLGTAFFLTCSAGIALFVAGWPLRNFLLSAGIALPALGAFVAPRPYQMKRLTGLTAAWSDFSQAPYQLKQSLISLGSGGLFGVGLGKGWQKLSFLPEANTDFVFAVVGEELGLLGTLTVLALWAALYLLGLRMLRNAEPGGFRHVAALTLLTQVALQAALNMAVVVALVPPTGIPHPLVSYGGSSLVTSLMSLGIVLSLTRPSSRGPQSAPPVR